MHQYKHFQGIFKAFPYLSFIAILNGCVVLLPLIEQPKKQDAKPQQEVTLTRKLPRPPQVPREQRQLALFVRQLRDPQDVVRVNAATSLGLMGTKAKPAVPTLIAALQDKHKRVRRASAQALGKIGAREAIAPLKLRLRDSDKWVAHSASVALKKLETRTDYYTGI